MTVKGRPRTAVGLAAVAVVIVVILAGGYVGISKLVGGSSARSVPSISATGFKRTTIYHSPQSPGYTSFVGAWKMPDESLRVAFVQATGNVNPAQRTAAPPSVLKSMGVDRVDPARDFWGLDTQVKYLRSYNDGKSWQDYRSDPFRAVSPQAQTPQATTALEDGTLLRRVSGDDLRFDKSVPHTAFLQRLPPGASRWQGKQVLLDPRRYSSEISRIRRLRDGRLVALGVSWPVPASTTPTERAKTRATFLLMISSDEGRTWRRGMTIPQGTPPLAAGEWDVAELPNRDLVAVMRVFDTTSSDGQGREQAILKRQGDGFVMTRVRKAPFPNSGHPELLATSLGPVLDIATTGIHYTKDGVHWTPLRFTSATKYTSNYYPRSVEKNGVVYVFGHVGSDDPYGQTNQSVTMDRFRLLADNR